MVSKVFETLKFDFNIAWANRFFNFADEICRLLLRVSVTEMCAQTIICVTTSFVCLSTWQKCIF